VLLSFRFVPATRAISVLRKVFFFSFTPRLGNSLEWFPATRNGTPPQRKRHPAGTSLLSRSPATARNADFSFRSRQNAENKPPWGGPIHRRARLPRRHRGAEKESQRAISQRPHHNTPDPHASASAHAHQIKAHDCIHSPCPTITAKTRSFVQQIWAGVFSNAMILTDAARVRSSCAGSPLLETLSHIMVWCVRLLRSVGPTTVDFVWPDLVPWSGRASFIHKIYLHNPHPP